DVNRNGLLCSKGVILGEGDAEEILIPQIVKKLFGINLDELGIGLINVGSTSFEYIASLFDDDRIQRKCAIVTDLDEQAIPSEHRLYKSTAQEKGQARKEKLSSLFNENNWVNCFYANTTFEIEFLDVNKENILTYVSPII
ncbi:ATP-dependent endonuclease, partial [Streptococcus agalactiae]|nr:ATP-dependent endonuclease [Streptococcus agalactiae]